MLLPDSAVNDLSASGPVFCRLLPRLGLCHFFGRTSRRFRFGTLAVFLDDSPAFAHGGDSGAKFAGSGGAIVGTFEDDAQYARLSKALSGIGCTTFVPRIAVSDDTAPSPGGTWRNS